MTAHEVLVAARNIIDREGWWNGGDDDENDPSAQCVSTACQRVGDEGFEAREVLLRLLDQPTWRLERIYEWNDAPGRTKAEVLDLFDRAIAATAPEPDPERVYTSDDRVLFSTGPARVYIDGVKV